MTTNEIRASSLGAQVGGVDGASHKTPSKVIQRQTNLVGVHYKCGSKIGEGSFGIIFEGVNVINNTPVAIKFEPRKCDAPQLRDEYRSYRILSNLPGIPQAYFFGQEGVHNILIIDLLGPSLEDLFDWCNRKFSISTVIQISKQMISLVRSIHDNNLIYRDIKPDNFLIGRPNTQTSNSIFIVDFGMAKQYRDPKLKIHIPYREKKAPSGTARYMSINTHLGKEQLRRDDLESLGHVFLYFLRGSLPWQGLKAPTNKLKFEKIGIKKKNISINDLCYGFPIQFNQYLNYVKNLKFDETPDYDYLIDLMNKALNNLGQDINPDINLIHYDWMDLNNGKGWDSTLNRKSNLHGYGNPNPPQINKKRNHPQYPLNSNQNQRSNTPLIGNFNKKNYGTIDNQNGFNQQDSDSGDSYTRNRSCFASFFCCGS